MKMRWQAYPMCCLRPDAYHGSPTPPHGHAELTDDCSIGVPRGWLLSCRASKLAGMVAQDEPRLGLPSVAPPTHGTAFRLLQLRMAAMRLSRKPLRVVIRPSTIRPLTHGQVQAVGVAVQIAWKFLAASQSCTYLIQGNPTTARNGSIRTYGNAGRLRRGDAVPGETGRGVCP